MEFVIRVDLGWIAGVFFGLALVGAGYNQLVGVAERRGWMEGVTSLAVALGALITLIGAAVICWQAALIVLVCFVASGLPMIFGSIYRYIRAREQGRRDLINEVRIRGDKTQTDGEY